MRSVAFVSAMGGAPWGGSEILWSDTCRRLASRGIRCSVAVKRWESVPEVVQGLMRQGIGVWRYPDRLSRSERVVRFLTKGVHPARVDRKRVAWLNKVSPSLVCISAGTAFEAIEWGNLARELQLPYVIISHNVSEAYWPNDATIDFALSVFRSAKFAGFVAQQNKLLFERQLGCALPNARVIQNLCDLTPLNDEFEWPVGNDGPLIFASVGTLQPSIKGQDLLVEAMSNPAWRSRAVEIRFYGAGPNEQSLKRLVGSRGLSVKCKFMGHAKTFREIWRECHALVSTSRTEGLPNAIQEAQLCGRIAVVTDVGGCSNLIIEGETGFVADAPTVESISRALEKAWSVRESWPNMGQAAKKLISAVYDAPASHSLASLLENAI